MPNAYSQKLFDQTNVLPSGQGARYSNGGVFWGTIDGRTGFWARPKRTKPVGGALLDRAQKYNQQSYRLRQRGPDGRFIDTGRAKLDTRGRKVTGKDVRVQNKGVPILLLQRETTTHHHQIVDRDAAMARGHERSLSGFQARFSRVMGNA